MDKELQDIKNALDCITSNMYGLTQLGNAMEGIQKALEQIGQIGPRESDFYNTGTLPATLGDIKQAIETIGGGSIVGGHSLQLDNVQQAIDRNTTMLEKLTEAVRTIAEINLQQLSLKEKQAAEFSALPWSKENREPNLDYGWVEDLEQPTGEKDLEDANF